MGMQNPATREPIDKLSEAYPDGTPFYLTGIRIVEATAKDFGKGKMVVVKVRGHERELGVWGQYLLMQAEAADGSDLNRWYTVNRRVIEGFGQGRPSKVFDPVDPPATSPAPTLPEAADAAVAQQRQETIPAA